VPCLPLYIARICSIFSPPIHNTKHKQEKFVISISTRTTWRTECRRSFSRLWSFPFSIYISKQGQGLYDCLNVKIRSSEVNYAVTFLWFCYNYPFYAHMMISRSDSNEWSQRNHASPTGLHAGDRCVPSLLTMQLLRTEQKCH
jgi:hypothetical protein